MRIGSGAPQGTKGPILTSVNVGTGTAWYDLSHVGEIMENDDFGHRD